MGDQIAGGARLGVKATAMSLARVRQWLVSWEWYGNGEGWLDSEDT